MPDDAPLHFPLIVRDEDSLTGRKAHRTNGLKALTDDFSPRDLDDPPETHQQCISPWSTRPVPMLFPHLDSSNFTTYLFPTAGSSNVLMD